MLIQPQKKKERFNLDIYRKALVYGIISDDRAEQGLDDIIQAFVEIYTGGETIELEQDDYIIVLETEDQRAVLEYLFKVRDGEKIDFSDVLSFMDDAPSMKFPDTGDDYDRQPRQEDDNNGSETQPEREPIQSGKSGGRSDS